MDLRAKQLTAQQAAALLRKFYKAYGPEVMRNAYWWESPAEAAAASGEYCWAFYDESLPGEQRATERATRETKLIGWGACQIQLDVADDTEAVMAAGVFPQYQRRGYRVAILDWMCNWAKEQGAEYAVTNTNNCNAEQVERKLREAKAGSPWVHAGDRWYPPPGYTTFVRDLKLGEELE